MITLPAEMYEKVQEKNGLAEYHCTERQIALHVVGLDCKNPYTRHGRKFYRPYRNYFAGENAFLEKLAEAGLMDVERSGKHVEYSYNRAGLNWLGEQLGVYIYDEPN